MRRKIIALIFIINAQNHGKLTAFLSGGNNTSLYVAYVLFAERAHVVMQQGAGADIAVLQFVDDSVLLRVVGFFENTEQPIVFFVEICAEHVDVHLIHVTQRCQIATGIAIQYKVVHHDIMAANVTQWEQPVAVCIGGEYGGTEPGIEHIAHRSVEFSLQVSTDFNIIKMLDIDIQKLGLVAVLRK